MKFYRLPVQLRFSDFDMLGHVNNARFASYMELGRIAFFDEFVSSNHDWNNIGLMVARLELDFKAPVLFGEQLFVDTGIRSIGNKSIQLAYRILAGSNEDQLSLKAEGITVMVSFSFPENKSVSLPDAWKQKMEAWMNQQ
jgi:acyl-CoA thioester hydrolase